MKQPFSKRYPLAAAALVAFICVFFTALGSALAQILALPDTTGHLVIAAFLAVSTLVGLLIMKRSPDTLAQYGFGGRPFAGAAGVWFYLPLVLIEILPLAIYGVAKGHGAGYYATMLLFTIMIGFNEETYFRGLVLHFLQNKSTRWAIWGSSVIFGLLHAANLLGGKDVLYTVLQILFAFLVGLVLAELLVQTGSLWVLIVWHAAHDFISYITPEVLDAGALVLLGAQVAILLVYVVVLQKKRAAALAKKATPAL